MGVATPPRVSVGLPVFNGERFLGEAIESIVRQSFDDLELIVSDNCSTDGTEEIARRYAAIDRRIKYVRNDRNVGAGNNFNQVAAMATGEYFKWSAHDDVIRPTYIERCVEALDEDPSAVLCQSQVAVIDEYGNKVAEPRSLAGTASHDSIERFRAVVLDPHWCVEIFGLMRRAALSGTVGHAPYRGSDRAILAELALRGRFLTLPERLFLNRDHPGRFIHAVMPDEVRTLRWYEPDSREKSCLHHFLLYRDLQRILKRSVEPGPRRRGGEQVLRRWLTRRENVRRLVREYIMRKDPRVLEALVRVWRCIPRQLRGARAPVGATEWSPLLERGQPARPDSLGGNGHDAHVSEGGIDVVCNEHERTP